MSNSHMLTNQVRHSLPDDPMDFADADNMSMDIPPQSPPWVAASPTISQPPATMSNTTHTMCSQRKRKPARIRATPIAYSDDEEPITEQSLGLYDGSDSDEDTHNNPLLHTQIVSNDGEAVDAPPSLNRQPQGTLPANASIFHSHP
ncbi:hypothetical protein CONPUDRAFT_152886 [Coniophora puteana RWD-64-598 SS2]|uniref:Uncharacterized protein n=1 Tax=Coniophora puteana (strain RWD-64-598) TaxID=741705 RepID=A0A5M3MS52_CONPW|nr:uncharacterized protein CONPUDRAFT_152886 [Coniophora puteana RWD-64-598 SS2]EIW81992.1 hypothetical protein CONPUDRAFT_152886 [Coniophora puteana RWD-64-598 SS2]